MYKPVVIAVCLLSIASCFVNTGCSGQTDAQKKAAAWTPAQSGMSKADFFKYAQSQMKAHGTGAAPAEQQSSPTAPSAPPQ